MGITRECIEKGIASFPGLAHRQQAIAHHKNVLYINDSKATNAQAVEKALLCYQDSPIYWLLGGRPKEGGITSLIPYFSSIQHAFLYGEAIQSFLPTLRDRLPYTLCETLEEAVEKSSALAFKDHMRNAVILLSPACASFDQFLDFEARGEAFCKAVTKVINLEKNGIQGETCFL
jgi:UDP-N-acetylmuramoylalanine--D-glutamate ligase